MVAARDAAGLGLELGRVLGLVLAAPGVAAPRPMCPPSMVAATTTARAAATPATGDSFTAQAGHRHGSSRWRLPAPGLSQASGSIDDRAARSARPSRSRSSAVFIPCPPVPDRA